MNTWYRLQSIATGVLAEPGKKHVSFLDFRSNLQSLVLKLWSRFWNIPKSQMSNSELWFRNFTGRCVGIRAHVYHSNPRRQFCAHVSVGAPTIQCIIRLKGKVVGSVSPHRTVVRILVRSSFDSSTKISEVTGSIVSTLPCPSLNQEVQHLHTPENEQTNLSGIRVRVGHATPL